MKRKTDIASRPKSRKSMLTSRLTQDETNLIKSIPSTNKGRLSLLKDAKTKLTASKQLKLRQSTAFKLNELIKSFSSHSLEGNLERTELFAFGEGDTGQLGLGEDVLSASYPKNISIQNAYSKFSLQLNGHIPGIGQHPNKNQKVQNGHILQPIFYVTKICAGGMHSLCLTNTNQILSFGCNDDGALGRICDDDELEKIPLPIELPNSFYSNIEYPNDKFKQLSAGDSFSAALTMHGRVYAWGIYRDENGKMGFKTGQIERTPTVLFASETRKIEKISCGNDHILMLTQFGEVLSAGSGEQGQLGRLSGRSCTKNQRKGLGLLVEPQIIRFPLNRGKSPLIKDIFATKYSSFAIDLLTNRIYGWGLNNYRQLGYKSKNYGDFTIEYFPVVLDWQIPNEISQISGGPHHTLILDAKGIVYALGRKEYGRLGLGDINADVESPTPIPFFVNNHLVINEISVGESVSYAITNNGKCYSWGMGSTNQLANGTDDEDSYVPTPIKGKQIEGKRILAVSAGGQHTLLLGHTVDENAL